MKLRLVELAGCYARCLFRRGCRRTSHMLGRKACGLMTGYVCDDPGILSSIVRLNSLANRARTHSRGRSELRAVLIKAVR